MPTGGVKRPIIEARIIITPNCTGFMPMAWIIGMKDRSGNQDNRSTFHEHAQNKQNKDNDQDEGGTGFSVMLAKPYDNLIRNPLMNHKVSQEIGNRYDKQGLTTGNQTVIDNLNHTL
jgi:hypothetical protein